MKLNERIQIFQQLMTILSKINNEDNRSAVHLLIKLIEGHFGFDDLEQEVSSLMTKVQDYESRRVN